LSPADGLGGSLGLVVCERLQRRFWPRPESARSQSGPGRRAVRPLGVPARRQRDLSHLLHHRARSGSAGPRLDPARPHAARPPGGVGGLARGLPADAALRVVAPPRRVRPIAVEIAPARASSGRAAEVDDLVHAAVGAGGKHATEPQDHGFMYGWSFYDPDGHHWDVVWMDPDANPHA